MDNRKQEPHLRFDEPLQCEWEGESLWRMINYQLFLLETDTVASGPWSPPPPLSLSTTWQTDDEMATAVPPVILYLSEVVFTALVGKHNSISVVFFFCVGLMVLPVQLTLYIDDPLSYKHINTPPLLCSTTGRGLDRRADVVLSMYTVFEIVYRVGRQEIFNLPL